MLSITDLHRVILVLVLSITDLHRVILVLMLSITDLHRVILVLVLSITDLHRVILVLMLSITDLLYMHNCILCNVESEISTTHLNLTNKTKINLLSLRKTNFIVQSYLYYYIISSTKIYCILKLIIKPKMSSLLKKMTIEKNTMSFHVL